MTRENTYATPDRLQRGEVVEIWTGEGEIVVGVVLSANSDPDTTVVKVLNVFGDRAVTSHVLSRKDTVCVTGELSESAMRNYPYREDSK